MLTTFNENNEIKESTHKITISSLVLNKVNIKTKTKNGHILFPIQNGNYINTTYGNRSDYSIEYYLNYNNILNDKITIHYNEYLTPDCDSLITEDSFNIFLENFMTSGSGESYTYKKEGDYEMTFEYEIL